MNHSGADSLRLRRAERRQELMDQLMDERNRDLAITQEQASAVQAYLMGLNNVIPGALIGANASGVITRVNRGVQDLLGFDASELAGSPLGAIWPRSEPFVQRCLAGRGHVLRDESEWMAKDGHVVPVLISAAVHLTPDGEPLSLVFVALDVSDRHRLEVELRHAQKLESLGQLSAGVAHEINTPMQFIGDNLHFIREAFDGLAPLLEQLPMLQSQLSARDAETLTRLEQACDLPFLRNRLPRAIQRALEGVERVSHIVEAMKAFSHPQTEMAAVDLNKGLRDTLTVAHNEYKYVAELQVDLQPLPAVVCNGGDINQVFLNLIVNAAHAIAKRRSDQHVEALGHIDIRSWLEPASASGSDRDQVVFAIRDDGCGIPEAIRHRVFDPFFTTKEVGKGTGQGLSISRSVIVDHHGGSLSFDSEWGRGTTFYIRIPVNRRL